ncbi:MAG TPA: carboxy terminal-processing peptidase [Calditrichia bacterium]|nr:carboxy terminal-processing peptidase [Calditrichota bacterium]HQV30934.1 carboxy terminal-processing peptidase [Calditrichia bacterium]
MINTDFQDFTQRQPFMKNRFILFCLIFVTSFAWAIDRPNEGLTFPSLRPEPEHRKVSRLISQLLLQNHYRKKTINDSLSRDIFNRYIEKLDYGKFYFLQSDIDAFRLHENSFDDIVQSGQLGPAYDIFAVYQQRVKERFDYVFERLQTEFNYNLDEYMVKDREEAEWAHNASELDEVWRKRLKADALDLKLAGKDWAGIQELLTKRYARIEKDLSQTQSEDVFQLLMNALTESFDPHTNYFSPKNFDDFKIRMSQSLEGIGARLSSENDYTRVVEIVPGGPADKSGLLFPKDRILGVGQGTEGEIVDVVGWRIDDVVQLIRGKKNSVVRLQVLKADADLGALPDTIALVRDKIKLEDQSAKSEILELEHEGRKMTFGVIKIPVFYADYEAMRRGEKNVKSTSNDVHRFLDEFKEKNVDGVIVDLRRNGGGYLSEAVELTGLFIDEGPVVQVRNSTGRIEVERDTDPSTTYDGPLAVVIDRLSASASEIFAAAIQDYNRGIIIGSQSYGKGTVQNAIDLNRYLRDRETKYGQLKLTIAKFYRVDGRSTQHVGVTPDVTFPSRLSNMEIGESSRKNALLYDKIRGTRYNYSNGFRTDYLPILEKRHESRLSADADYAKLLEDIDEFEKNTNTGTLSLNETKRRAELKESGKKDSFHDEDPEAAEEEDKKDLLLDESAHVLGDMILLSQTN